MKRISSVRYRRTGQPPLHSRHEDEGGSFSPPPRARAAARLRPLPRARAAAMPPATAPPLAPRRELHTVSRRTPPEPSRPEPLTQESPPTAAVSPCRRPPPTVWMVRRLDSIGRERETKWMVRLREETRKRRKKERRKERKRKKEKKNKKGNV
jgi:hypothetical protein